MSMGLPLLTGRMAGPDGRDQNRICTDLGQPVPESAEIDPRRLASPVLRIGYR